MVLYADVLVALNYVVNFLLLLCCEKISGLPQKRKHTMAGALFGGVCSLAIFLPPLGAVWASIIRLSTAGGMIWLAYPRRNGREYLRLGFIFLLLSFLFAGAVLAFCLFTPQDRVAYYNGVVYFHISPIILLSTTTVAYLLVGVLRRLFSTGHSGGALMQVRVTRGTCAVTLSLLEDTGNSLTEPFSGLPAAVCPYTAVESLLTEEEKSWYKGGAPPGELPTTLRLLRYRAVGGEGLLGAFRPDGLEVLSPDGDPRDCMAYIAVSPEDMAGCEGLFNPRILTLRI